MASGAVDPGRHGRVLAGTLVVLTAFNLRPIFSSLPAVLPEILGDLGASPLAGSLLTTVPVLCLGVFAPLAPAAAQRVSAERLVPALLALLALGTALRAVPSFAVLLVGTALAGAAIALVNVLLPSLVKRDFPDRVASMTGLYVFAIAGGAAAAAASTVPLAQQLGSWEASLACWAVPAAAVALLWLARSPLAPAAAAGPTARLHLWTNALAWQVTLLMGVQSALAYCGFGWMAPILRERGIDAAEAGLLVALSITCQMVGSLGAPWLATRGRDQRAVVALLAVAAAGGLLGLLLAPPALLPVALVAQGLGQGGLLSVTMTIIVLRSPDPAVAARLSGMAQGVGYAMAAAGPLIVGVLRTATGGFAAAGVLFAALGAATVVFGWAAGRNRVIASQ